MDIKSFVEYVKSFYFGPEALYHYPWTESQIIEGCFVQYNAENWGDGDSVDREFVRDYLIAKYGE